MKSKLLILFLVSLIILPLVSANIDNVRFIGKQDDTLDIKDTCYNNDVYCSVNTECNITIIDPNQLILTDNLPMTNNGAYHNYSLTQTNITGYYESSVVCVDGADTGYETFNFLITYNGREEPTAIIKVFFIVVFVILLALILISILNMLYHFSEGDMNLMDVAYMMIIYFVVLSLKYFNAEYMGSKIISDFSDVFIYAGALSHVIIPIIVGFIVFVKDKLKVKSDG